MTRSRVAVATGVYAVEVLSPMEQWVTVLGADDQPRIFLTLEAAQKAAGQVTGGFARVLVSLSDSEWGIVTVA